MTSPATQGLPDHARRFGKYYLLRRINVGGMAEVFKARATGLAGFERVTAVKRILPAIAADEEFITMFSDEARIAALLSHPNIAQIFEFGRIDRDYFIELEYVPGKNLREIFNYARTRGERIPVPMACHLIMKLCEGLDYAHNKRDPAGQPLHIVHRDVSPQNIIVSYEGDVKIVDFGIAKAACRAGHTGAGILKGKFAYMSPEQIQGMQIDQRSDVFGAGICLYEMLTSERLFAAESDLATLAKVRSADIPAPSRHNGRVAVALDRIVLKALARNRAGRYQTAMKLHDDLQAFMHGSGLFFDSRDLGMYMRRAFAEDFAGEKEGHRRHATPRVEAPDPGTGLAAFDDVEPVSTVSALRLREEMDWLDAEISTQVYDRPEGPSPEPSRAPHDPLLTPAAPAIPGAAGAATTTRRGSMIVAGIAAVAISGAIVATLWFLHAAPRMVYFGAGAAEVPLAVIVVTERGQRVWTNGLRIERDHASAARLIAPAIESARQPAPISADPTRAPQSAAPESPPASAAQASPARARSSGSALSSRAERSRGIGTLRVQSRPWAQVLVDGRPVGTTPLLGLPMSAGRHTLTLFNPDFGLRKTVTVKIEAGQTLTQQLVLY